MFILQAIHFLNPSVKCQETKEICVAICLTDFVKASGISESQIKAAL